MNEAAPLSTGEGNRGRVEYISDDGVVVLALANGQRRYTTIPPECVAILRQLAEIDREFEM